MSTARIIIVSSTFALNLALAVYCASIVYSGGGWRFARPMDYDQIPWGEWAVNSFVSWLPNIVVWAVLLGIGNTILFYVSGRLIKSPIKHGMVQAAVLTLLFFFIVVSANFASACRLYVDPPTLDSGRFQQVG